MNLSFSKFNALQMRSSSLGWSIIQTTDQTKEIMYTNDGGVNWYKKTPANVKVVAADFIDSTIAWVYGLYQSTTQQMPSLFYTNNGGNTWSRRTVPAVEDWERLANTKANMHVIDNAVWVLLSNQENTAQSLYYTTTNGKYWSISRGLDINNIITGITFINANIGFITTTGSISDSVVYQTIDEGQNWSPLMNYPLPIGIIPNVGSIATYKPVFKNNKLIIPTSFSQENQSICTYVSVDEGVTWNISNRMPCKNYFSFSFPDWWNGHLINEEVSNVNYYQTTNGGDTWNFIDYEPLLQKVFCLRFINSTQGWGCNQTSMYQTMDGGVTWSEVAFTMHL
jgi:photosystem II stability/assembly factor-like uncharacterized protein